MTWIVVLALNRRLRKIERNAVAGWRAIESGELEAAGSAIFGIERALRDVEALWAGSKAPSPVLALRSLLHHEAGPRFLEIADRAAAAQDLIETHPPTAESGSPPDAVGLFEAIRIPVGFPRLLRNESTAWRFKAFLSYSHASDSLLAPQLQSALHQLARPWYSFRAMRTFRDQTTLALTPSLWPGIVKALNNSEYFVLLASPAAARSSWVNNEVAHWLETRGSASLLLVITAGTLAWEGPAKTFRPEITDCLPPILLDRFEGEPFHLDLAWARDAKDLSLNNPRFKSDVATLAAALRGCEKDEILGEDVEQRRWMMKVTRLVSSVILTLLLIAVSAAWYANRESGLKEEQRQLAIARQFAAESRFELLRPSGLPQRSLLTTIESLATSFTTEGYGSWTAGLEHLPALERSLSTQRLVQTLRFTADGRRLVTSDGSGIIEVWNTRSGVVERRFVHAWPIAAWDLDLVNGYLATAAGSTVFVWDLDSNSRRPIARLGRRGPALAVRFSSDGKLLSITDGSGEIGVWSTTSRSLLARHHLSGPITSVSFHPRHPLLAAGGPQGVSIWNYEDDSEKVLLRKKGPGVFPDGQPKLAAAPLLVTIMSSAFADPESIQQVEFSPSGRLLSAGSEQGSVFVFEEGEGWRQRAVFRRRARPIEQLAFLPDESFLLARGLSAGILFCDLRTGQADRTLATGSLVRKMALVNEGSRLLTAGTDGTVQLWDIASGAEVLRADGSGEIQELDYNAPTGLFAFADRSFRLQIRKASPATPDVDWAGGFLSQVFSTSLSPDGLHFAAGGDPFTVKVWNTQSGQKEHDFFLNLRSLELPLQLDFSSDSKWIAVATGNAATVWDLTKAPAREIGRFQHGGAGVLAVAFGPGNQLLTGSLDGRVRLWGRPHRPARYEIRVDSAVACLAHHPTRPLFAVGTRGVSLRSTDSGEERKKFLTTSFVTALRFSPDGRWLAAGDLSGLVHVFDPSTGKAIFAGRHGNEIRSLRFTRNGRYLLSASGSLDTDMRRTGDNSLRLWDLKTGSELVRIERKLPTGGAEVDAQSRIMSADGRTVKRWDWRLTAIRRLACAQLVRNLSLDEWRQLFGDLPYRRTCEALPGHETLLGAASQHAAQGNLTGAEAEVRRALELVPRFDFDPYRRMRQIEALVALNRADRIANEKKKGWIEGALAALGEARRQDPDLWIPADFSNRICWFGALGGAASTVLTECNHAVAMDPEEPAFRDSRGLARALIGDPKGAIQDFLFFVEKVSNPEEALQRSNWIDALQKGESPFTPAYLSRLAAGSAT